MQDSAGSVEPSAAEVRAELERILASRCFEQAGRSSSFLRFVVEQTLAGQGDRLKGYTIAVEVFSRPPDFDAQTDPLVRVEAGRLRRRLIEYYADEGRDDPVRLELPRGRYYVVSTYHAPAPADAPAAAEVPDMAPGEAPVANAAARNRSRWRRIRTVPSSQRSSPASPSSFGSRARSRASSTAPLRRGPASTAGRRSSFCRSRC